jgi:hypothetical protein
LMLSKAATAVVIVAAAAWHVCAQSPVSVPWRKILEQPTAWYASVEAAAIADNVLKFQRDSGGWPKDVDMTAPPSAPAPVTSDATIDNGATTTQIRCSRRSAPTVIVRRRCGASTT